MNEQDLAMTIDRMIGEYVSKEMDKIYEEVKANPTKYNIEYEVVMPRCSMCYAIGMIGEECGQLETNGWDADYWQVAKAPNGAIWSLYGSGYYGGITATLVRLGDWCTRSCGNCPNDVAKNCDDYDY